MTTQIELPAVMFEGLTREELEECISAGWHAAIAKGNELRQQKGRL